MTAQLPRPGAGEYGEFYAGYVAEMPDGDVLAALERQGEETFALFSALPEERGGYRYAPGKWAIKDLVTHLADAERVFAYRALLFARGDETPLASFEQDQYVPTGNFNARTLTSLADEFAHVRATTLDLYTYLDPEALGRRGSASGFVVSVRAMAFVIAGHVAHHERVLREKYL